MNMEAASLASGPSAGNVRTIQGAILLGLIAALLSVSTPVKAADYKEYESQYQSLLNAVETIPEQLSEDEASQNMESCRQLLDKEKAEQFVSSSFFKKKDARSLIDDVDAACNKYEKHAKAILAAQEITSLHQELKKAIEETPHSISQVERIIEIRAELDEYEEYRSTMYSHKQVAEDAYSAFIQDYYDAVEDKVMAIGEQYADVMRAKEAGSEQFESAYQGLSELIQWIESGNDNGQSGWADQDLEDIQTSFSKKRKRAKCPQLVAQSDLPNRLYSKRILAVERGVQYFEGTLGMLYCAAIMRGVTPGFNERGSSIVMSAGPGSEFIFGPAEGGDHLQLREAKHNGSTQTLTGRQQGAILGQLSTIPQD